MLLLNINSKAYMGSPLVWLHFTLMTLNGQYQGDSGFKVLYLVKEQSYAICYY